MVRLIHLLQALLHHVRINLCRRNIGVAQHQLHRPQVRAALEQVRGEAVPELMGRETRPYTGPPAVGAQQAPDAGAAQARAVAVDEHPRRGTDGSHRTPLDASRRWGASTKPGTLPGSILPPQTRPRLLQILL